MSRVPSPQNNKRACLCPDGSYSTRCCDGSFHAQGIGNITGEAIGSDIINGYSVEACSDGHTHNVHIHNTVLTVGSVYYLTLENHHDQCYKILSERNSEGIHINTTSAAYVTCDDCIAAN